MTRALVILLMMALSGSGYAPPPVMAVAAPSQPMPPATPVTAPAPGAQEGNPPGALWRLGTLKISGISLNVPVYEWGCRDSVVPNYALRWGCTQTRNQFLVGHAYGVFKPYYRAYNARLLKKGMIATFTDRYGKVTKYRLSWVRIVPKTYIWNGQTGERWAWNATTRKALTLQTCWGSTNAYRIITRFDEV